MSNDSPAPATGQGSVTAAVARLCEVAASRRPPAGAVTADHAWSGARAGAVLYQNEHERLGIDFTVERLAFPGLQTIDPRVVRIPPGKNNERHKHAHETIFVVLAGTGEVLLGDERIPAPTGSVTHVPRWIVHQTLNTGATELVVLAITDFGFTRALLGDYDRRQRLAHGGRDVADPHEEQAR